MQIDDAGIEAATLSKYKRSKIKEQSPHPGRPVVLVLGIPGRYVFSHGKHCRIAGSFEHIEDWTDIVENNQISVQKKHLKFNIWLRKLITFTKPL